MIEIGALNDDTILTIDASKDGDAFFSINGVQTHFKAKEFRSKDGAPLLRVNVKLIKILEKIRERVGCAIIVNSGYRTPEHNKKVGGATNSQHVQGRAADICIKGAANVSNALQVGILAYQLGANGIGVYNAFTHIDTRTTQAPIMWDGTEQGLIHGGKLWF